MRVLVIGPEDQANIKAAVDLARASPMSAETMQKFKDVKPKEVLRLEDRAGMPDVERVRGYVQLSFGYNAIVTFEDQPEFGLCMHLSVSVDEIGKLPDIHAVHMIGEQFGILMPLHIWLEEFEPEHFAVNILAEAPHDEVSSS